MTHRRDSVESHPMRARRRRVSVVPPIPLCNSKALWELQPCQEYKYYRELAANRTRVAQARGGDGEGGFKLKSEAEKEKGK